MKLGYYINHSPSNQTIDVMKSGDYNDVIVFRYRYTKIAGDFETQYVKASKKMRKLNS